MCSRVVSCIYTTVCRDAAAGRLLSRVQWKQVQLSQYNWPSCFLILNYSLTLLTLSFLLSAVTHLNAVKSMFFSADNTVTPTLVKKAQRASRKPPVAPFKNWHQLFQNMLKFLNRDLNSMVCRASCLYYSEVCLCLSSIVCLCRCY